MLDTKEAPPGTEAGTTEAPGSPAAPSAISPEQHQEALAEVARLKAEVQRLTDEAGKVPGRIADLQRAASQKDEEIRRLRTERDQIDAGWREWARHNDGKVIDWSEIEKREFARTGEVLRTEAGKRERAEIVTEYLDSDDDTERAFGRYLRQQPDDIPVTRENVTRLRAAYDSARGVKPTPQPTPAAPAAPAPKAPPATPGAGGPQTTPGPAYQKGDDPSKSWARVYKK